MTQQLSCSRCHNLFIAEVPSDEELRQAMASRGIHVPAGAKFQIAHTCQNCAEAMEAEMKQSGHVSVEIPKPAQQVAPTTMHDFDRSEIFDSEVNGLCAEVHRVCKTHDIPFIMIFEIGRKNDEGEGVSSHYIPNNMRAYNTLPVKVFLAGLLTANEEFTGRVVALATEMGLLPK